MVKSILITGGSGMIGTRLTELLLQQGARVSHLGRTARSGSVPAYSWDVKNKVIDSNALDGVDTIVHLAGAGISASRWTPSYKLKILESRLQATATLFEALSRHPNSVRTVVCASAIGYYGFGTSDQPMTEESRPGADFLSDVVVQWEREMDRIATLGVRLVKIRVGIVLSDNGGALEELARPIRWGIGAPLGTGEQVISWIHIDDLCGVFIKSIMEETMRGVFNAAAPSPVTNKHLTVAVAKALERPLWMPHVPAFALRLLLGQVAEILVNGGHVSSRKIQQLGYSFKYPDLAGALKNLIKR